MTGSSGVDQSRRQRDLNVNVARDDGGSAVLRPIGAIANSGVKGRGWRSLPEVAGEKFQNLSKLHVRDGLGNTQGRRVLTSVTTD